MLNFRAFLVAAFTATALQAFALEKPFNCSPINHCQVDKTTWSKVGWKTDYTQELKIKEFCIGDRPALQLEPGLGIELWNYGGRENEKEPLHQKPWISVSLYTRKLTYVVASAQAPLATNYISFTYRLQPNGNSLIKVTCQKL